MLAWYLPTGILTRRPLRLFGRTLRLVHHVVNEVRLRRGCFSLDGPRVRLGVARGAPELWVRLPRPVPYPVGSLRPVALRNWRRTHLLGCLSDKAELAGIRMVLVNERGTSSTCPECHRSSPSRGDVARTAGTGATETSSVPETSPPGAAGPRVPQHASRTVGPGDRRHGVTGAVTSSTCTGPAWHRPARETRESLAGGPPRSRISGCGDGPCRRGRHPARIAAVPREPAWD
jgi:hypothetical protein